MISNQHHGRCVETFIVLGCFVVSFCSAQGTFQNLNFESAIINPIVINGLTYTPFDSAFPGWNGTPVESLVGYNLVRIGSSGTSIVDANIGPQLIGQGIFSALLQGGSPPSFPDASMAQTGLLPADARSLHFLALSSRDTFVVSMGGAPLSLTILQDFGGYREYGADISPFAGQLTELRFTQLHGLQRGNLFLDDISFSSLGIPEPSTWALLVLGSALFWRAARAKIKLGHYRRRD